MATGTVKWFNTEKGYGFIGPDDGSADVYVHISSVQRSGLRGLSDGQTIAYELLATDATERPSPKTFDSFDPSSYTAALPYHHVDFRRC